MVTSTGSKCPAAATPDYFVTLFGRFSPLGFRWRQDAFPRMLARGALEPHCPCSWGSGTDTDLTRTRLSYRVSSRTESNAHSEILSVQLPSSAVS